MSSLTDQTSGGFPRLPTRRWQYLPLTLLAAAFALANGMGYGSGNHRQYLLHALHALDPTFLANDWFTTQTEPHHRAFNVVLSAVGRCVRLDLALAAANALAAGAFLACVAALAARFYRAATAVTATAALIIVLTPPPGLGSTAILKSYFEPATIGSVGLLAGLTLLVYERYRLAGLTLALAAVFHINYMVWAVVLAAGLVVLRGRRLGWRASLWILGPLVPAALLHLPFLLAGRSAAQSACAAEAGRILHDIYMPLHSRPRTWELVAFVRFGAILAAGAVAVRAVPPQRLRHGPAMTIFGLLVAILLTGAAFTLVVQNDTMALLFPWRLGPLLVLMAQIAVAGTLVTTALTSDMPWPRTVALWTILGGLLYADGLGSRYGLAWVFTVVLAMSGVRLASLGSVAVPTAAGQAFRWSALLPASGGLAILHALGAGRSGVAVAGAYLLGGLLVWRGRPLRVAGWCGRILPAAGPVGLLLIITAFVLRIGVARKDLLGPPPPPDEAALYAWCREHTDRGAVFIIPPLLSGFRIMAERAVVIDWKCMPVLPCDTLEWYRRHVAICGEAVDSAVQAARVYRTLNAERVRALQAAYGARYVIVESEQHRGSLVGLHPLYAGEGYLSLIHI